MRENRLLVMEDDRSIRNFIARVAEKAGFVTYGAETFEDFLTHLKQWSPLAVILDLNMPETDGVECMRRIRDIRPEVKLVIMSGMDEKVRESAARLGREFGLDVAATLGKPVGIVHLREQLAALVDEVPAVKTDDFAGAIDRDDFFFSTARRR